MSIIMHDLGKRAGIDDNGVHSTESAIFASSILDKFNLSQDVKERIVNLVLHHHFSQEDTKQFSKYFQLKEDAEIAKIMTKADTKSILGHEIGVNVYRPGYSGNNPMPVSRCHVKYDNYTKQHRIINGKVYECRVESLNDFTPDTDMGKFGFVPGTKYKDIIVQTHSVDNITSLKTVIENYDDPTYYMALSTSVRKLCNSDNGYGQFTLVLSTSKMNRGGGDLYWKENGYGKGLDDFTEWHRLNVRVPQGILEGVSSNIQDEIIRYLMSCEYPTRIKEQEFGGKLYTKEELTTIYQKIVDEITSSSINEVLAANPKVQQIIIHHCPSFDDVPDKIVQIASQYKIPILIEK